MLVLWVLCCFFSCCNLVLGQEALRLTKPKRETLKSLHDAAQFLQREEYTDGVRLLWEIYLNDEDAFLTVEEDPFLTEEEKAARKNHVPMPMKERLTLVLETLPPKGREVSELLYGSRAKQDFEAAVQAGKPAMLSDVVKHYPSTQGAMDAAFLLGFIQFHEGNTQAVATFTQLARQEDALRKFDPSLSLLWGASIIQAGQEAGNRDLLIKLKKKVAEADWSEEDLAKWGVKLPQDAIEMIGGAAKSRQTLQNAKSQYDSLMPLLVPSWSIPLTKNKEVLAILQSIEEDRQINLHTYQTVGAVKGGPVFCGDKMLIRGLSDLKAIDKKTGKVLWTAGSDYIKEYFEKNMKSIRKADRPAMTRYWTLLLQGRLQWDMVYNAIAVDENAAYVLEDIWKRYFKSPVDNTVFSREAQVPENPEDIRRNATNRLAAYDLETGKELWTVGASAKKNGADQSLRNTIFLGTPLAENGKLYVLGEDDSQILLFVLDAKTGKVDWSLELGGSFLNFAERMENYAPIKRGDVLYCPMPKETLIAIDVQSKKLVWLFETKWAQTLKKEGHSAVIYDLLGEIQLLNTHGRIFMPDVVLVQFEDAILFSPFGYFPFGLYGGHKVVKQADGTLQNPLGKYPFFNGTYGSSAFFSMPQELVEQAEASKDRRTTWELVETHQGRTNKDKIINVFTFRNPEGQTRTTSGDTTTPVLPDDRLQPIRKRCLMSNLGDSQYISARGFVTESAVYVPLLSNEVAEIDRETMQVQGVAKNPAHIPLGSLYPDGDSIYTRSFTTISAFSIAEAAEKNLAALMAKNTTSQAEGSENEPAEPPAETAENEPAESKTEVSESGFAMPLMETAKNTLDSSQAKGSDKIPADLKPQILAGRMAWDQGDWTKAFQTFKSAYEKNPDAVRETFTAFLVDAWPQCRDSLKAEKAFIANVFQKSRDKVDFWFAEMDTSWKQNDMAGAAEAIPYLVEAGLNFRDEATVVSDRLRPTPPNSLKQDLDYVRRDLIVARRLAELAAKDEKLRKWTETLTGKTIQEGKVNPIYRLSIFFSETDKAEKLQDALLERCLQEKRWVQAELLLRKKRFSVMNEPEKVAALWFQQYQFLAELRPEHAAGCLQEIQRLAPNATVCDGKTAAQFIQALAETNPVRKHLDEKLTLSLKKLSHKELDSEVSHEEYALELQTNFYSDNPLLYGCTMSPLREDVQTPAIFWDRMGREIMRIPTGTFQQVHTWTTAEHLFIFRKTDGTMAAAEFLSKTPRSFWPQKDKAEKNSTMGVGGRGVAGTLGAYADVVLIQHNDKMLAAYDLFDGRIRWWREFQTKETVTFADSRHFYIAEQFSREIPRNELLAECPLPDGTHTMRYDMRTGEILGMVELPSYGNMPTFHGMLFLDPRLNRNVRPLQPFQRREQTPETYKWFPVFNRPKDSKIRFGLYEPTSNKVVWQVERDLKNPEECFYSLSMGHDRTFVVLANEEDGHVEVFDLTTGKPLLDTHFAVTEARMEALLSFIKASYENAPKEIEFLSKSLETLSPQSADYAYDSQRLRFLKKMATEQNLQLDLQRAARKFTYCHVQREGDDFILVAMKLFPMVNAYVPCGPSRCFEFVHATVNRFDAQGNPKWAKSKSLEFMPFLYEQPSGLPFLLFGRKTPTDTGFFHSRIGLLDKETGDYIKQDFDMALNYIHIVADPKKSRFTIHSRFLPDQVFSMPKKR